MIPMVPIALAEPSAELDSLAYDLALLDGDAIDRVIAGRVAAAVEGHRIDEAVRWQRVRLRAHRLRARLDGRS